MNTTNVLAYLISKVGGLPLSEIVEFCTEHAVDMSTVTVTGVGGEAVVAAPKRRGRKPGRKPGKKVGKKAGKKKVPPRANGKDTEAVVKKASKKEKKEKKEKDTLDPKAVLAAIKKLRDGEGWVKAEAIKSDLGVDPADLRTVLNALIEEGKAKYRGKARGTQYALA